MTYNMTIEQIKSLLSRFYEGQTTPEEERLLAAYFRREDVPEDLQQDKQLFLLLAQTSEQEMPQDIAEEITAFVENIVRVERDKNNLGQTKIQPLIPEDKQHKGVIFRLKTPPKMWYRVAATVAILLTIGGGVISHQKQNDPFRDTCSTPEEAAAELHKANAMITKASQQCLAPTRNAFEQVEDTKEIINKHITF
ncbi:MAG: hypothetical protein IJQ32_05860 [Paludibacteraceae bacterium]|nr:hypothetical protein [Paludibacteraceae bacterium]